MVFIREYPPPPLSTVTPPIMNVNLVKFKMREYIDVWVTSSNRGPPPPCKQALLTAPVLYVVRVRVRL